MKYVCLAPGDRPRAPRGIIRDVDILDFDHKAVPGQRIKNTNEVNGGNT
jgi:hypothetical protein